MKLNEGISDEPDKIEPKELKTLSMGILEESDSELYLPMLANPILMFNFSCFKLPFS